MWWTLSQVVPIFPRVLYARLGLWGTSALTLWVGSPATAGTSRRTAPFRLPSRFPAWSSSLFWCSNPAWSRRSWLPTPRTQCSSRTSVWCGAALRPVDGLCWGLFAVVSCGGPLSSSGTGWNWPSTEPDGKFTDSGKGLTYCTQISPRCNSRLRLLAGRILPCVFSTTPNPEE